VIEDDNRRRLETLLTAVDRSLLQLAERDPPSLLLLQDLNQLRQRLQQQLDRPSRGRRVGRPVGRTLSRLMLS
jgi:hypothetical protein